MKIFSLIIFLFISFALISCSENENNDDEPVEKSDGLFIKDNILYESPTDAIPFTGRHIGTADGKKIEYEVVDGKKEGEFILYYLSGNIELQGSLKANKNIGHWKYYYESGELESEGNFSDNKPDGIWTWYYKDGSKKEEGMFKEGKREGDWYSYKPDGTLDFKKAYADGLEVDPVEPEDVKK